MNEPARIVMATAFVVALAAGLVWAVVSGPSSAPVGGVPTPLSSAEITERDTRPPPAPTSSAASNPSDDGSTIAPPDDGSTIAPPDEILLADALRIVEGALAAWGEFAVTGDLELVGATFDRSGPQYRQLADEAEALAADPLGPPPYRFTFTAAELVRPEPRRVVLPGSVVLTRPGEKEQTFRWRIHLRWSGGEWLLWTVDEVME